MTHDDKLRELLLSYDDLSEDERARLDRVLAEHPEYRETLDFLRAAERCEEPVGSLPIDTSRAPLDTTAREVADSLESLRRRLGLAPDGGHLLGRTTAATRHRGTWMRRLLPSWPFRTPLTAAALAAAALVMVLVARDGSPSPFQSLGIATPPGERGVASAARDRDAPWRTGEAFVLSLELSRPAHVVVLHIGPTAEIELLHPLNAELPVPELSASEKLSVPSALSGEVWRFLGDPGNETFLVAAGTSSDAPLREVLATTRSLSGDDREQTIERAAEMLSSRIGPTRRIDVLHVR